MERHGTGKMTTKKKMIMATERQQRFCRDMYAAAQRIGEISPVFVAAQACLESSWGVRESGINNFFGGDSTTPCLKKEICFSSYTNIQS